MRIKIVSSGPDPYSTKVLNDKGEMIEGVQSCLVELVAGELPKATLIFNGFNFELKGDFDLKEPKEEVFKVGGSKEDLSEAAEKDVAHKKEIPSEVFFPVGKNIETFRNYVDEIRKRNPIYLDGKIYSITETDAG